MRARRRLTLGVVACLGAAAFSSSAQAITLVATSGSSLSRFDSGSLGVVTSVPVTGLQSAETLVGIDYRPADGEIYGIGSTSRIYRLNILTGAATQVGTAGQFTLNGTAFGTDVDPVSDRIRSVSNTEQNLRLNPIDGTLSGTDTALNPAGNVVAAAYSNNFPGATTTTLYDIDSAAGTLVTQNPPNSGTLATVGSLGLGTNLNEAIGFDIAGENGIAYATITTGGISRLYSVNLTTGAATLQSSNGGAIGSGTTPFLGVTAAPKTVGFDSAGAAADEGGTATLTVYRRGLAAGALTVDYATSSGTASSGQDFEPASGTLSWANGDSTSKPIAVAIKDDADPEGAETLNVTLSNPTAGTTIAPPATATVTIGASDQPEQQPGPPLTGLGPVLSASAKTPQRLRAVLKRGAAFTATTSEACLLTADLRLGKRLAKRLKLPQRIARKLAVLPAGSHSLRVKPTRRAARSCGGSGGWASPSPRPASMWPATAVWPRAASSRSDAEGRVVTPRLQALPQGISASTRVPPADGLSTSRRPLSASTRAARPRRPEPRAGRRRRRRRRRPSPSRARSTRLTLTVAWDACAYFATFVIASATT